MSKQALVTSETKNTVSALLGARQRYEMRLFIILFIMLLGFTPLLTELAINAGVGVLIGVIGALALTLVLMRWPIVGLYILTASALLVEQDPLPTPVLTDRLYVFHWPSQLEGFIERPIGVLVILALFIWVVSHLLHRKPLLRGGALWIPFLLFMLCVIGGIVYGLGTGGNVKIIVVQFRPLWYMFTAYVLAYNFVTKRSHVRNLFWLVIASAGVKSLQGVYIYFVIYHHKLAEKSTIMSHEESFFFVSLLLLVIIFSLYHRYRPQLIAALCVTPPVIISMVANQRRTDYVALLVGIVIAWVLVFKINPAARKRLLVTFLITVTLGAAYILAFQNSKSSFGQPARSIVSVFHPAANDTSDASSNLYRDYENSDLIATAKHDPLGVGFGKPFLQPKPLTTIFPQILTVDPYYNYIPHNTIYWIWADLGPIGYFSLWFLFGSTVLFGSTIVRKMRDPYLQVIAIYIVAITIMEVIVAFADYQLFFYRNVIYQGVLCGILAKLPILDKEYEPQQKDAHNELTDGISTPSKSLVGAGARSYHLLKALARKHTVSLLTLGDESKWQLQTQGINLQQVRHIPFHASTQRKRAQQLTSVLRGRSYLADTYKKGQVQQEIDALLSQDQYDAVIFESVFMAGYHVPATVSVIIDQHNIEHELQRRTYEQERSWSRKWYSWLEMRNLKPIELERCRKAQGVLVTSERECLLLKRLVPQCHVEIVPNGVDIEMFSTSGKQPEVANRIVFTGTMSYYPNIQAVLFFAKECWPRIQAQVPDATWQIVGTSPPPEVEQLAELPGVTVTGAVPDVRPYLADAAVALVPLLIGSGTRLKILEALAMQKAVVTTSLGCEGLAVENGKHLMIADQPELFAQVVVDLLQHTEKRASLGHAGRALVEVEYSWERCGNALNRALEEMVR